MKLWQERLLTWVLPAILACVLVGLALLQYRWSREISQAENVRIHSALEASIMNFREDLSRELATLCVQLRSDSGASPNPAALAQRLQLWQTMNSASGLVRSVYFWTPSDSRGNGTLRQLLPSDGRFQSVPWPPQMQRVRQALSSIQPSVSASVGAGQPPHEPPSREIGAIDQSVPVLAVSTTPASNAPAAWMLVELDAHVLQQQVLPQLTARYFGDARTSDYEVAVVGSPQKDPPVIYASDPQLLKSATIDGESSVNLFGPPMPDAKVSAFRGPYPPPPLGSAPPMHGSGFFAPIRFDPINYETGKSGDWRVVVRHRNISVAAVVAQQRHRNLALGLSVLLMLAASMALIMLSSHRARRLAQLQMEFVAGISHELRTPVAAILSISDNLASGIVNSKQQFAAYGDLIQHQARQLNSLIEQVLRFSATRNESRTYRLRNVHISEVIDAALENTAVLIASSGIEVQSTIEEDLPALYTDSSALSQALQNLIANAVKYGGDTKWIGISAAMDDTARTPELLITVADRGIGIDSEHLGHVFEPFYRSPQVAESEVHGTGLGLALAKTFVEGLGGRITVTSAVGKGSNFTVHLPISAARLVVVSEAGAA
jgi:signal transduction histidine kinase